MSSEILSGSLVTYHLASVVIMNINKYDCSHLDS